ncbi:MAG: 16S rRNA (cytosine(967)-C(5))-methyltransferase RsmB, partial [Clostridia bacterium]|nr:16S rRNA (cytosine(967)-C(5))-methyltransferase RsmB [Clostridia bacterium]
GDRPAPRPMGMPHPAAKPEQTAPSGANPRLVAVNVLCDVMEKDSYAALSLDEKLSSVNLNQLDRRLCASIVYRTLENLYYLDFALNGLLTDPDALEPKVRAILRTAACQILLHDRVPDSAAVNEAVNLTRALRLDYATGMVNAVLRKLAAGKEEIKWPDVSEGAHALHVLYSLPEWLAEQLIRDYGVEEAVKIASFRTERHSITIRPTYGKEKEFEAQLAKKVWETEKGVVPGAVYLYGAMQIARDSDFAAGLFSIQGEGSMLAAEAVGARPGMQILDACAAPGGKTAYLAERMGGAGRVYAWDLHDHRAELIRGTVRRLHLDNVRVAARDASVLRSDMVGTMDAVLLDAPCSGLGVMDDKPDVKYRPTPESIEELTETQKKLLDTCCEYVRPGGVMVYSTCSMLKDENERQIEAFLQRHPEFTVEALPATVPEQLRAVAGPYGLQLLPHRDHVEGFFVARMRKSK